MNTTVKQLLGEFFASLFLGYLGLGVVVSMVVYGSVTGMLQFGLTYAFVIACVVAVFNAVSGAHFNPAVTLGLAAWGYFPKKMVLPYWLMQFLGWGAGAALLYVTFGADITAFEAANGIVRGAPESAATAGIFFCSVKDPLIGILTEFVMTFFLVMVVFAFIDPKNANRPTPALFPIMVGLTVAFLVSFGGSMTGTAINPARDFAPRVVAWLFGWGGVAFPGVWYVYFIGPLLGGVAGGGFYKLVVSKLICSVDPAYVEPAPETHAYAPAQENAPASTIASGVVSE